MCLPISHEVVIGKWTKKHINIIFRYLFKDYFKVHTNFRINAIGHLLKVAKVGLFASYLSIQQNKDSFCAMIYKQVFKYHINNSVYQITRCRSPRLCAASPKLRVSKNERRRAVHVRSLVWARRLGWRNPAQAYKLKLNK